jgi:GNAT superfamily N-acetyltransferase
MDCDPEYAGDEEVVRIQKRIFEELDWVSSAGGLVSRGNRVSLIDAWRQSPKIAIEIARKFDTAVFFLHSNQLAEFTSWLNEADFGVSSFLLFSSGDVAFTRSDAIASDNLPASCGLKEIRLDANTPRRTVASTQKLMATCGLPPMPGYFLRGLTQQNLSIVLVDQVDEVVGCVVAVDESGAGADFAGWYFPSTVGVAPNWQGKALGRWLNARAIQIARSVGAATFVHEGVSAANVVSQRMIVSCGLIRDDSIVPLLATTTNVPGAWH